MTWDELWYLLAGMVIGTCLGLNVEGNIELWLKKLNWHNWYKPTKDNLVVGIIALACAMMVGIGIVCLQLIQDLREQSRLGRLSDEFSLQVSEATVKKEHCQNQPPPEIAPLPITDARRSAWFHQCQADYYNTVNPLNKKRAQVVRERNDAPK